VLSGHGGLCVGSLMLFLARERLTISVSLGLRFGFKWKWEGEAACPWVISLGLSEPPMVSRNWGAVTDKGRGWNSPNVFREELIV